MLSTRTDTKTPDGFTIVARKLSANDRSSSLYYHISTNPTAVFTDTKSRKIIREIKGPTKDCKAYLLLLKPNINNVDLTTLLPPHILAEYKNLAFKERHIRIDQTFRAANSDGVVFDLKSHWHYTETYGEVTIHLYFDYDLCVGVFIKPKNKAAIEGTKELQDAAKKNAEDALNIISIAIQEVAATKKQLRSKFEKAMQQLQISNLKVIEPEKREELLKKCSDINQHLKFYNEDIVDKRFDMLSKIIQEHPADVSQDEEPQPLSVSHEQNMAQSTKIVKAMPLKAKKKIKPRLRLPKPTKSPEELVAEYNSIKTTADNIKVLDLDVLIEINAKIEKFKDTLIETFYNTTDSKLSKTCELIEFGLKRLKIPTLLSKFQNYADLGQVENTKKLFEIIKAEIPASFYSEFILKIMKTRLNQEEQNNINELCSFFYGNSDDYRLFMSHLADIMVGTENEDGQYVGFSPFSTLFTADNFDTFKLLFEQCASSYPKGYMSGDKIASLTSILSLFSFSPRTDPYLQFLLDKGIGIEEKNNQFAKGVLCESPLLQDSKHLSKFHKAQEISATTKQKANEAASRVEDHISGICLLPYFGAAIVAYVHADYQSPKILKQLAERSSFIHTIRAFASYCTFCTVYRVVLEQERFGIQFVDNKDIMRTITKTSSDASITPSRQVRYVGIILRVTDDAEETTIQNIKTLYEVVQQKLLTLTAEKINDIIVSLQQAAQIYERNTQLQLSIPCHKAILMLLTRLQPSIATHRLTLHTFYKIANLYDLAKKQDNIFNVDACESQTEQNCANATLLGYYSIYHQNLMKDPVYAKVESAFNDFQRSKKEKEAQQKLESLRPS